MINKSNNSSDHPTLLRDAGLKATPARLAVLNLLSMAKKPLSINDIKQDLKRHSSIDQATIYRIIKALEKKGLIKQVDFQHGHAHYELRTHDHHHHVVCENCGKVADISKCDTTDIEKQALKISGFSKINDHSLELFGLCNKCAKSNSQPK